MSNWDGRDSYKLSDEVTGCTAASLDSGPDEVAVLDVVAVGITYDLRPFLCERISGNDICLEHS